MDNQEIKKLPNVSANPHFRSDATTQKLMLDVCIAMIPATVWAAIQFGPQILLTVVLTVAACVASEYIYEHFMRLPITITDLSAVVTGMILALNMPPRIPVWVPMLGGVFAIIVVKQLYGGIGQNFMNPALAARCFLLLSFAGMMTNFDVDAITGATPLVQISEGANVSLANLFLGTGISGAMGEVSALMLLIGGIYMIVRKVISYRIPCTYLATFAVFAFLFHGFDINYVLCELCAGGLMFGAFFMATDYVTSPITTKGQIVFGVILGVLTGIFRLFGGSAEGVSYAIILSNILVPIIERFTMPVAFGKEKAKK